MWLGRRMHVTIWPSDHTHWVTVVATQGVDKVTKLTRNLEEVSLRLQSLDTLQRPNMTAVQGKATSIDTANQVRRQLRHASRS